MRVKLKQLPEPGEERTVRRFLWWPLRIGHEIRWLERTAWIEEVGELLDLRPGQSWWPFLDRSLRRRYWKKVRWAQ